MTCSVIRRHCCPDCILKFWLQEISKKKFVLTFASPTALCHTFVQDAFAILKLIENRLKCRPLLPSEQPLYRSLILPEGKLVIFLTMHIPLKSTSRIEFRLPESCERSERTQLCDSCLLSLRRQHESKITSQIGSGAPYTQRTNFL
jgi:hypothetical protein